MAYDSLKDFLTSLEDDDQLLTVSKEVDRKLEVASVDRQSIRKDGPALLFTNVRGNTTPVATGILANRRRCLLAVGRKDHMEWKTAFAEAYARPLAASVVSNAPCQEKVLPSGKLDLDKFPILWYNPKDAGYYVNTGLVISKDPDTGVRNSGIYRSLVIAKDKLALWIAPKMHLRVIARKYLERGKPCPVAIVIGVDPSLFISTAAKLPYGVDEFEFAGAVRGAPVKMVRCSSLDLEVPANAEMVIEGEFRPGSEEGYIGKTRYVEEGPFGEYTGYYGRKTRGPVLDLKAITHRDGMVYHGLSMGPPPNENANIMSFMYEALFWQALKPVCAEQDIRGIHIPPYSVEYDVVVSIRKRFARQAVSVGNAILAFSSAPKRVIVVDDDIDPYNPGEVNWAMVTRSRYEDIFSQEGQSPLDPVVKGSISSKMIIDATIPLDGDKVGDMEMLRDLGVCTLPEVDVDLSRPR